MEEILILSNELKKLDILIFTIVSTAWSFLFTIRPPHRVFSSYNVTK